MPELRTDYIADLANAYQRGQAGKLELEQKRSDLSTAAQNRMINDAKLQEYYANKEFEQGFNKYYSEEKQKNKEATMEGSLEKYAMEKGRLDVAMKAREASFRKAQEQRQKLSSFAQLIGQLWTQGKALGNPKAFVSQMKDQVIAQFPEFDDYDPSAIKEVEDTYVVKTLKNDSGKEVGDLVLDRTGNGKHFFVEKTLPKFKEIDHPVMMPGKKGKRFVAMDQSGKRIDLGPWIEDVGGDGENQAQIKFYKWLMRTTGMTSDQLKSFILHGKQKSNRDLAISFASKLFSNDMGPIEFDAALRSPEGKKKAGEDMKMIISLFESAIGKVRGDIEAEEAVGPTEAEDPLGMRGLFK